MISKLISVVIFGKNQVGLFLIILLLYQWHTNIKVFLQQVKKHHFSISRLFGKNLNQITRILKESFLVLDIVWLHSFQYKMIIIFFD